MSSANLTFVEEIVLLALDDETGALLPMPPLAFRYALAGAAICDLALLNRIDTDPNQLVVLSKEPTGDPLLDHALSAILSVQTPLRVSGWLNMLSEISKTLEAAALDRLVARGILRREEKKILWVFGTRRYPTVDNQERAEVRTRLADLILGDDLPDPRDAILISLLSASHLSDKIFAGKEFKARSERMATLAKMDLVGREVAGIIDVVTRTLNASLPIGM
jgi:Golgi phosphoprotein 3 (GPP34).